MMVHVCNQTKIEENKQAKTKSSYISHAERCCFPLNKSEPMYVAMYRPRNKEGLNKQRTK